MQQPTQLLSLLVTPLAMHKTMPPMLLAPNNRALPTQDRTWELNPHQCKPITIKAVNVNTCKMKWK
jgi:hypothetical protein